MVFKKVDLLCPSYMRADEKLPTFIRTAQETASSKDAVCFSFCLNTTDTASHKLVTEMCRGWQYEIVDEALPKPHLAKYFNMLYDQSRFASDDTLVSMVGDDMEFRTKDWDQLVLQWANHFNGVGIFFGDDCKGTGDNVAVHFFTSRRYVDAMKPLPFMAEMFPCDDMDVIHSFVAEKLKRRFYIPQLKIFHNHATLPGRMDDTWKRLRKVFPEVEKNRVSSKRRGHVWGNEPYEDECVANVKRAMPEEFVSEIVPVMTTHDRIDLLRQTVDSYMSAVDRPEQIHVFDDCSTNADAVRECVNIMPGTVFHHGEERLGATRQTPHALRCMFEKTGAKAVVVIDSDTEFNPHWWTKLNCMYRGLRKRKNFGCFSLFNANDSDGAPHDEYPNTRRKLSLGAFGTVATREYWQRYIAPQEIDIKTDWDNHAGMSAVKNGHLVLVSSPSFLQHTGVYEGTHVGSDNPTYAADFLGTFDIYKNYCRSESGRENTCLVSMPGRYGDVILAGGIVNAMRAVGLRVDALTIPYYADLVDATLGPIKKVLLATGSGVLDWASASTKQMNEQYPGYQFYINLQPGSPEHHNNLFASGLSMAAFAKGIAEGAIGRPLPPMQFAIKPPSRVQEWQHRRYELPLAVICPGAISLEQCAMNDDSWRRVENELSEQGYEVRYLVKARPKGMSYPQLKNRYEWGHTFIEAVYMIAQATLLLSEDSGMAWAGMFWPQVRKRVYHRRKRLSQTNMMFSTIDPAYEDVVVD